VLKKMPRKTKWKGAPVIVPNYASLDDPGGDRTRAFSCATVTTANQIVFTWTEVANHGIEIFQPTLPGIL